MATRSAIAIKHGDRIKSVYCHWDGYIDHNGRILLDSYQSSPKVNNLIALGDISSLRNEIGEKHDFGFRPEEGTPEYEWTTFYGRDREEENLEFKSFGSEEEFVKYYDAMGVEYYYIFDNGVWFVKAYEGKFLPLHEELAKLEEVDHA